MIFGTAVCRESSNYEKVATPCQGKSNGEGVGRINDYTQGSRTSQYVEWIGDGRGGQAYILSVSAWEVRSAVGARRWVIREG
jgi:hypothetical protein